MSQLKLTIVGDPTPLRNATRQAEKSLRSMQSTANKASAGINKAFGALGVGIGFTALANGLKQATKAASDDRKAQGLLAQSLRNTVGATEQAIAGAENYIKKTQLQTAVLDDELRPALATAVRATGSLAGGQKLLDTALDVSAGTGKDLTVVTKAIARAQSGQLGGLQKLIPGIKATDDIMGELNRQFKGAAVTAANLDPYKRLEIIFNDIQETIGAALLPALEEFAAYITSPEGQKNLEQIVDLFVAMGQAIANVIKFLIENITLVKALTAAVVFAKVSWTILSGAVKIYTVLTKNAVTATKLLRTALITTGIGALVVGLGFLAEGWINANKEKDNYMDPDVVEGDSSIHEWAEKNRESLIPYESDAWLRLGYESYGNYLRGMYNAAMEKNANQATVAAKIAEVAEKVKKAVDDKIAGMKKTAESFRDAVGLAFGTFGKDENSVFNVDMVIAKMKRVVEAAKGFAGNIKKLREGGADQSVIDELIAMGPAQGNIVAKGLLGSGKLSEYLNLRGSLYNTGASAGAQQAIAGNASYTINLEGTSVKATDIINAIRAYEKKHGRKYLVG
jgi:hypothetical protein